MFSHPSTAHTPTHMLSSPFSSFSSLSLPSIFIIQDATPVVYGYVRFMSFLAPSRGCVRARARASQCVCKQANFKTDGAGCGLLK